MEGRNGKRNVGPTGYTNPVRPASLNKEEFLKMEVTQLTFIVTDDCNFNCSYCFQHKEKKSIHAAVVETAVDFFYPYFSNTNPVRAAFYGGEPLLAFDRIQQAVRLLQEKNKNSKNSKNPGKTIEYSITTNGSLLTPGILEFFNRHRFRLTLSFDGKAQDTGRKKNTRASMHRLIEQIKEYPGIMFEINSVFSPRTVSMLSDSIRDIVGRGGDRISINISSMDEWSPSGVETLTREMNRLVDFLLLYYRETGKTPVNGFLPTGIERGIFQCNSGRNHFSVSPGGELWGCFLFHDYFKTRTHDPTYSDYSFGLLNDFVHRSRDIFPPVAANYSELRQDLFQAGEEPCFLCPHIEECMVCPVNAAYSSGSIGKISPSQCRLTKIQANARKEFQRKVSEIP